MKARTNPNTALKLLGAFVAALLLAACQEQATPEATTQQGAGRARRATAAAAGGTTPEAAPAAQPTALPARVVVANATLSVDGVMALGGPLVAVAFEGNSKVMAVNVSLGQRVQKGEVLAEMDGTALNTALQQAQEQLVLKQAQINGSLAPSAKTELDTAKASLASAYAGYAELKKGPAANDVEQALRSWNQAKNSLYSSQLNRDTACAKDKLGGKCQQAEYGVKGAESASARLTRSMWMRRHRRRRTN